MKSRDYWRALHSVHGQFDSKLACALVLLTMLTVLASCTLLLPDVHGALHTTLRSKDFSGVITNKGTITVNGMAYSLPGDFPSGTGSFLITYNPDLGFTFLRWETSGPVSVSNANAQSTQLTVSDSGGVLTAVYGITVGGAVVPTNTLTGLAPYLATIGLVAATVLAIKRKRRQ